MDSKEIDAAMRCRSPVMYDGKRYERIIEYASWSDGPGKRRLSAVLLSNGCSVRVPAEKVEEYNETA